MPEIREIQGNSGSELPFRGIPHISTLRVNEAFRAIRANGSIGKGFAQRQRHNMAYYDIPICPKCRFCGSSEIQEVHP